ncbi:hypothetical protein FIBSPDRAFT_322892 [Athelia psychrophila]|uniref:BTB domain-containing protein n=1 Tax=Athelia psychrophila TaxID=1759441 RepID=A0A167WRR3_9AGAM|nr:hypothetical protein FIBSPDRAFT_322892 [Fibularhizoctonia sp. CBS 109695]
MSQQGSSGAPSQLKRVEEATSEPCDGPLTAGTTRSPEMWLDDGNIVIEADKTQFKVHRSLLSAHSHVFKDMFSIPQGPSSAEEPTVEGCPVVHLSDSAVDVAIVLRALFLGGHVTIREPVTIDIVAAFIRMGKKYEIESLRVEGLQRLFYEYPVSLQGYDNIDDYSRITSARSVKFDVAMLAREQNLSSVLPLALMLCCMSSAEEIIEGSPRTDGTFAKFSPDEIITSLYARERLAKLQVETTFAWIDASDWTYNACPTHKSCGEVRTKIL